MNTKIKSALIAALGLGVTPVALAEPSVVNKMIDPMKVDQIIRSRIVESINLVASAKAEIMTSAFTPAELVATADYWNDQANGHGANSKYVSSVQIDRDTGEITLTFNAATVGSIPNDSTLVFTPYIQDGESPKQLAAALASQVTGVMDWSCASVSNAVGAGQGLPALILGTLPAKYAPQECR